MVGLVYDSNFIAFCFVGLKDKATLIQLLNVDSTGFVTQLKVLPLLHYGQVRLFAFRFKNTDGIQEFIFYVQVFEVGKI